MIEIQPQGVATTYGLVCGLDTYEFDLDFNEVPVGGVGFR